MAKILHLIGNFNEDSGGAQRVILDIINSCANSDLVMGVCSIFGEATLAAQLPAGTFNKNFNYENKYNPKTAIDLYRLIAGWQPDILHVHSSVVGVFGRPLARMFGIKLISTVHNIVTKAPLRNRMIDNGTIGLSDAIVCVSDTVKNSVLETYSTKIADIDIYTIRNCLDCAAFRKNVVAGSLYKKKQLCIEQGNFIVGTVGSLNPSKGQYYLIEAWKQVLNKHPNTVLLIVGEGKEKANLQRLAKSLNIENSIRFLGARNDVPELLNLMDIFVFPSLYEGLGIALLEAMCMEKIVIASKIKPLINVLNSTGILVPSENSELLAKKIIDVIQNYDGHKQLGHQARKRVEKVFSPDEFGREYMAVYTKYLRGSYEG